jgi:hypothetical protein
VSDVSEFLSGSEADEVERPAPAPPRARRLLRISVSVLAVLVGFAVYLRLASTRAVNSDGSGNALQAWDMLHGNLLLRGWRLSDVSFYTTELPQYMLVEWVHGLNQDVVHIAAAMTYTLAVLMAVLVARGHGGGRERLAAMLIAGGIMLAPQLSSGTNILLSSPDHIGTSVPLLLAWFILDRARPSWYIAIIVPFILGWTVVADTLALYVGIVPLVLVCVFRACRAMLRDHQRLSAQWYEFSLAVGAVVAAAVATLALHLIRSAGGFYVAAPNSQMAPFGTIVHHNLPVTGQGLLLLGGADFIGLRLTASAVFTALHVAGVALAAVGILLALWRFLRDQDIVAQLLVAGIVINLATYAVGTHAVALSSTREITPVLPLSAALAGRQLAGTLKSVRVAPAFLAVLAGYAAGLAVELTHVPVPAQNSRLAYWLAASRLYSGLSGYWESNVVTLTSGARVRVRALDEFGGKLTAGTLETRTAWYDPAQATADFVVLFPGIHDYPGFTAKGAALATFGQPARIYYFENYTILVWDKNILADLR